MATTSSSSTVSTSTPSRARRSPPTIPPPARPSANRQRPARFRPGHRGRPQGVRRGPLAMSGAEAAPQDQRDRRRHRGQGRQVLRDGGPRRRRHHQEGHVRRRAGAVGAFRWFAKLAIEEAEVVELPGTPFPPSTNHVRYEPHGVTTGIIPWNFPFIMAAWKLGPALAAGNCAVLKPASFTSITALMLGEVFQEVTSPGVANIVRPRWHRDGAGPSPRRQTASPAPPRLGVAPAGPGGEARHPRARRKAPASSSVTPTSTRPAL